MIPGLALQILFVFIGIVFLILTFSSLAKRRINEAICLIWGITSLVIILAGILLRPVAWKKYISVTGLILAVIVLCGVLFVLFTLSVIVSEHMRKSNEMAIQISLLKREVDEQQKVIEELKEKLSDKKTETSQDNNSK
ncbi:MAG: DUF2304 domain-containing protein [Lachnospiraceae bacterium]|nr:DUF2304 domain-containing protein [Lachnospiraceae bacterium]